MNGRAWQAALILGAIALTILMAAHPTSAQGAHGEPDQAMILLNYIVHGGAIAGAILMAFGAVGLSAALGFERPLVLLALVTFFFAAVGVLIAATLNGFVAPKFMAVLAAGKMPLEDVRIIGSYNWWLNQAMANFHLAASSAAILFWSLGWPSARFPHLLLRAAGIVIGIGLPLVFLSGYFTMDVHGVLLVAAASGAWFIAAALMGYRVQGRKTTAI